MTCHKKTNIDQAQRVLLQLGFKSLKINNTKRDEIDESIREVVTQARVFADTFGVTFKNLDIAIEKAYTGNSASYSAGRNSVDIYGEGGDGLGHELAHWLDNISGKSLGALSRANTENPVRAIASAMGNAKEFGAWKKTEGYDGNYLTDPTEMFARAIDQYLYLHNS